MLHTSKIFSALRHKSNAIDLNSSSNQNNVELNKLDSSNSHQVERHKHLHFLNSIFKDLIENPGSKKPFNTLLNEVEAITHASASAIYLAKDSGEYELLAITDESEQELLNGHLSLVSTNKNYDVIQPYKQNKDETHDIKSIRLSCTGCDSSGILFLKIPKAISDNIRTEEMESLQIALSGILSSTQHLDMSKRIALHEERALIARELHDSLAQSLSYIKIQVSRLQSLLKTDSLNSEGNITALNGIVEELRTNLNISYKQLRELITTFRLALNSRDLAHALEDSVEEFENRSGVAINLDNRLAGTDLAVDEEIHILQIIREAISNVIRHAQANRAEIVLSKSPQGLLTITIDDDGIGIDDKQVNTHRHGMIIMQQRAHDLNGKFRVQPSSLSGTRIKVTFESKKV